MKHGRFLAFQWATVGFFFALAVSTLDNDLALFFAGVALGAIALATGLHGWVRSLVMRRQGGAILGAAATLAAMIGAAASEEASWLLFMISIPLGIAILVGSLKAQAWPTAEALLPPAPPVALQPIPPKPAPTFSAALGPRKICPNCGTVRRAMRSALCANCGFDDAPGHGPAPPLGTAYPSTQA